MNEYYVEIVAFDGEAVERRIGPCGGLHSAEKVDRGVNINLNHERFFTRIVQQTASPRQEGE